VPPAPNAGAAAGVAGASASRAGSQHSLSSSYDTEEDDAYLVRAAEQQVHHLHRMHVR
jgi:hypothetical protein